MCLAAAAIAGDERPAGANQLCKADKCSPGQRWDTSRPIKVRLPPDSEAYEVFVRVVPHDRADLWSRDLDKRNNAIMLAAA